MIGQEMFGSGDINLAAAILTMGIQPDPAIPIELIARDNGKDYIRFHFNRVSDCGKYRSDELSAAWSQSSLFKSENPDHPFSLLMEFISTRPDGCVNQDEWLCHAAAFLALPIDAVRSTYRNIVRTCVSAPESPASYVCAFIRNKMDLISAAKKMERDGMITTMMDRTKSIAMIPAKAPKRIRDLLLSHIR